MRRLNTCHGILSIGANCLRLGVTLLELIVVLAIIGVVLALLVPAMQRARERARETACCNNMNQLRTAMGHLLSIRKKLPDPAPTDAAGGWGVAILPFLDEKTLWEHLANNPGVQSVVAVPSRRPLVMTCPFAWEGDSSVTGIPASHYSMFVELDRTKLPGFKDVPLSCRIPWIQNSENVATPQGGGPHQGGYFDSSGRFFGD
jgi:prepilin-type N-terminal cleavage/methylation domain-containing protein